MGNELTKELEKRCKVVFIQLARATGLEVNPNHVEVVLRIGENNQYFARIRPDYKPLYATQ